MSAPLGVKKHHQKQDFCSSRARYREGRNPTAVKVYTVSQESKYLLVQGVPSVGAQQELVKVFALYGAVEEYRLLDEYPAENFTEVFWIKYKTVQSARIAKKKLDDYSFYGGVLHVCYAPEYEGIEDTREKLQERRKAVAKRIRLLGAEKSSNERSSSAVSASVSVTSSDDQQTAKNLASNSPCSLPSYSAPKTPIGPTQEPVVDSSQEDQQVSPPYHEIPPTLPSPPQIQLPWMQQPHQVTAPGFTPIGPAAGLFPAIPQNAGPPDLGYMTRPVMRCQGQWPGAPQSPCRCPGFRPGSSRPGTSHGLQAQTRSKCSGGPSTTVGPKEGAKERMVEGQIVRDYKVTTKTASKLVPRQVAKLQNSLKRPRTNCEVEVDPCAKQPTNEREDMANSELKRIALVLGNATGPSLPEKEEKRRQTFLHSDMGDGSLEESMIKIREKVKAFSAKALPPQVLKKLKR